MRARPLATSLLASLSICGLSAAQDAPKKGEPTISIDNPAADAADREKVKLIDNDSVDIPGVEKGSGKIDLKTAPDQAVVDPKARVPESVRKMTDEQKRKFNSLLQDAATYLGGIRVQEAFEKLVQAEAMAPDYAPVQNLKGAAYTKLRAFDKAEEAFSKAVELDPSAFMSRFNLTEIQFVGGKFDIAMKAFAKMLADNPKVPASTKALIEFKILICKLKLGDEEGAKAILEGFDPLHDHPGYYFGNAAIHFSKGEDEKAKAWMISAEKIYTRNEISIYTDSFIEVGWIENLQ